MQVPDCTCPQSDFILLDPGQLSRLTDTGMSPNMVSPTERDVFFIRISPSAMPSPGPMIFYIPSLFIAKTVRPVGSVWRGVERGDRKGPQTTCSCTFSLASTGKFSRDGCGDTAVGMSREGADCHGKCEDI